MTSVVVGVGSNPAWSFSPAVDLFDQQTTGRLDTPKLVPNNNSNASQAAASPNAAAGASAKPAATSLDAVFAKFGVGRTTTAAAGAATSGSTPASASVVSAVAAPVNLDAISSRNVLIIGAGDILHAFKTLVLQHRRTKKGEAPEPMHLHVFDGLASSTARHLLLLAIAFDVTFSLRGRTELFLEVYGNAQIQEKTQIYINRKVKEIRSFLSGSAGLSVSPATLALGSSLYRGIVDLSHLRNKDLDDIDHALDFMTTPNTRPSQQQNQHQPTADGEATSSADGSRSGAPVEAAASASSDVLARVLPQKDPNVFDIVTLRDHRLRGYYGDRFDARANLIDWDYHMRLKAVASIIHIVHYKKWRMTGLAFEERLCTYTYPNRTLASYREAKSKARGSVTVRGYWSDTLVSPYIALGVECNERRLFMRKNNQHVKTSPHVCEYNLLSLLYELETGDVYALPQKADGSKKKPAKSSALGEDNDEEIVELPDEVAIAVEPTASTSSSSEPIQAVSSSAGGGPAATTHTLSHTTPTALSLQHIRLAFINGAVKQMAAKKRYHGLYDRVFVSQFDIACISESAAQQAAAEAKAGATAATASDQPTDGANPPAPAAPKSAATPDAPADPFPLNKLLKPNAVITVETVKFLPVTREVKSAYVQRVHSICRSAGWQSGEPALSAWSFGACHSWSGRSVDQPSEEQEKQDAEQQPARLNFRYQPADQATQTK